MNRLSTGTSTGGELLTAVPTPRVFADTAARATPPPGRAPCAGAAAAHEGRGELRPRGARPRARAAQKTEGAARRERRDALRPRARPRALAHARAVRRPRAADDPGRARAA